MEYAYFGGVGTRAVAVFQGPIVGSIYFEEFENLVKIVGEVKGLPPGPHGFHIHEYGDLTDHSFMSACSHFNPFGTRHGCPGDQVRHVGDLGNIVADYKGRATVSLMDDQIKLRGDVANVIGRSLMIHKNADDCGRGGNAESLKSGNAGQRIACAVIGLRA